MKKNTLLAFSALSFVAISVVLLFKAAPVIAAFNANNIMTDDIFTNSSSMSAAQIDAFLNANPSSCISSNANGNGNPGFRTPDPQGWSAAQSKYLFGGNVTAGQAIYDAAQLYSVNPQVILSTMQKEQSLITGGAGCFPNLPDPATATPMTDQCGKGTRNCTLACTHSGGCMNIAMGYGCPGYCDAKDEGFSMQLTLGTWLLRFGQQRAFGILTGYQGYEAGDENFCYTGPLVAGTRKRSASTSICAGITPGNTPISSDGTYTPQDSGTITVANGSTASLYNFTPFISGNQHFVSIFEGWFGSTLSDRCLVGSPGPIVTDVAFRRLQPHLASGDFLIYSGTTTNCIESHAWNVGFGSWQSHIASNATVISPGQAVAKFADLTGNGIDNPILIALVGTSTNKVEFHVWNYDMKSWIVHTATNLSLTDAQDTAIEFADLNGTGKKEPVVIKYKGLSNTCPDGVTHNCVEIHTWNPGLQTWKSHTITNLPGPLDPTKMQVAFADLNRDGRDEAIAMGVSNTSTGNVEFHIWAQGLWAWQTHIVSNLPTANTTGCSIKFNDLDTDRIDNGVLVCTQSTSTGRIEFHVWNPGMTTWQGHYTSNQQIL